MPEHINYLALRVLNGVGHSDRCERLVGFALLYFTFIFSSLKSRGLNVSEVLDLHYLFFFGMANIIYFVHEVVNKLLQLFGSTCALVL